MKDRLAHVLLCACVLFATLAVVGCDSYEPESTESGALAYYQDKYGVHAQVADSHGLGSYALFGYSYHGMEYIMSDGTSVVYFDDEGVYRDNRQAAEIQENARAFAENALSAMPEATVPAVVLSVGNELGEETYEGDGICWHARYDGDIGAFLQEEMPPLVLQDNMSGEDYAEGRFVYNMAFDEASAQAVEDALVSLSRYFDMRRVDAAIVDAQAFEPSGSSLFDDAVRYTISFTGETAGASLAVHFKPVFVALAENATISSGVAGVTLAEGDVSFAGGVGGFCLCRISGEAARADDMQYYIRNDSDHDIIEVVGLDRFRTVCSAHEHRCWCTLTDGATYYLGDADDIVPRVEVESVSADKVVIRYHTFFKDRIKSVRFRTIGLAQRDGSGTYETVSFDSRIVRETEDGWLCEINVPATAKPDNELALQFSYNGDKDVTVQIMQDVKL